MLTMSSALDRCARLYASRAAIIDAEATFTWVQHLDRVARAAGVLQAMGLRPGDRFGTLSRNTFRHAELLHAGYWSGLVPVPVNIRLAPPEIGYILQDAEVKALAVDEPFLGLLDHPAIRPCAAGALAIAPPAPGRRVPVYENLLDQAQPAPLHHSSEQDDAILLYTGGTTGRSKGVRLTHLNVVANGMQVGLAWYCREEEVYLHVAPMFHSADLLGTAFTLLGGGHAYLPQFSPAHLLKAMQDLRVTRTMLAPTMIIMTLQQEAPARYDLARMRSILYGSAPMALEWIRRTLEAFPAVDLVQAYGLTETSPILTILGADEHRQAAASGDMRRLKAAGRPLPGIDLRILDDMDREVACGEPGEVCVRGPNVTRGYLNQPEVSAAAFRGGWFHTGDVGCTDADGYMYLLDRKKDMIITGGENVYSSEVEQVIYQHPDVSECAVVGVPDEVYGEALYAVIVPAPGRTITQEALIEHCRGRIAGYKIPRQVAVVAELPKSAMGKILKSELRRLHGDARHR